MENEISEEYLKARDDYDNTINVIENLCVWKKELEEKVSEDPKDILSHGLISEVELAITRLQLLAGTDIRGSRPKLTQLQDTADDYGYRIMCEWGYADRAKWEDAEANGEKITVKAGDYVISM